MFPKKEEFLYEPTRSPSKEEINQLYIEVLGRKCDQKLLEKLIKIGYSLKRIRKNIENNSEYREKKNSIFNFSKWVEFGMKYNYLLKSKVFIQPPLYCNNNLVFVDFRYLENMEFVIRNALLRLEGKFMVTFVCGPTNYDEIKILCNEISNNIRVLKIDKHIRNQNDYNDLLLGIDFWQKLEGSNILLHQFDAFIFKSWNDEFLNSSYLGAPCYFAGQELIINGGFSFRKKEKMISLLKIHKPSKIFEDIFFTRVSDIDQEMCKKFAFQEKEYDSFGGHKFWQAKNFDSNYMHSKITFTEKYKVGKNYTLVNKYDYGDDVIKKLENQMKILNCDIICPTIYNNGKLIYFGSSMYNNDILNHSNVKNFDTNHCLYKNRNTHIIYNGLYITNGKSKNVFVTPYVSIEVKYIRSGDFKCLKNITSCKETDSINEYYNLISEYNFVQKLEKNSVLIIEDTIIDKNKDCGSKYMFYFINSLLELNYNVHYIALNWKNNSSSKLLAEKNVYVHTEYPFSLEVFLKVNNYFKFVVMSRKDNFSQNYPIIRKYCPRAKIIYFTHDLEHLRIDCKETKKVEISNILNANNSIIISSAEYDYLKSEKLEHKISYYPISYEIPSLIEISLKKDIYFVGSLHKPNIEAIQWFIENVFPKLQNIILHVIGNVCSKIDTIEPNIILHHNLDEENYIQTIMTKRMMICPLLSGAGVKGKIIEALSYKIPIVTTSYGVQGTGIKNNIHAIISSFDSDEFANCINKYYDDTKFLNKLELCGFDYFKEFHSYKSNIKLVKNILDNCPYEGCEKKYKCLVTLVVYNSVQNVFDIIEFLQNMSYEIYFDIKVVVNNSKLYSELESKNTYDCVSIVEGDNSCFDYSGHQHYYNNLENKDYDCYFITNETLFTNYPTKDVYLYLSYDIFKYSIECDQPLSIGTVDSFGKKIEFYHYYLEEWIRSNMLIINGKMMKLLNFKLQNLVSLSTENYETYHQLISNWLKKERYRNCIVNTKRLCIANEHFLSCMMKEKGSLKHIRDVACEINSKVYIEKGFNPAYLPIRRNTFNKYAK